MAKFGGMLAGGKKVRSDKRSKVREQRFFMQDGFRS